MEVAETHLADRRDRVEPDQALMALVGGRTLVFAWESR